MSTISTTTVTDDIALVEVVRSRDAVTGQQTAALGHPHDGSIARQDDEEPSTAVEAEHEYPTGWRLVSR